MIDVIISCFATPSKNTLNSIKSGTIPQAAKYNSSGGILKNLLTQIPMTEKVRSIGILTFSGGTAFAKELIKSQDAKYIDAWIILDGLHFSVNNGNVIESEISHWLKLVIKLPSKYALDTTKSAKILLNYAKELQQTEPKPFENYDHAKQTVVLNSFPVEPVTIRGGVPPETNTREGGIDIHSKQIKDFFQFGEYFSVDIGGVKGTDHIFAATYGLQSAMQALSLRWDCEEKICYTSTGNAENPNVYCRKLLTTIPTEKQPQISRQAYALGMVAGFAAYGIIKTIV